jgi:8-oxo-dGTP pyrophosphatase MutT (NUDIX family)
MFDADRVVFIKQKQGYFIVPGGHMEPNETPIQTALREVKEELGLHLEGESLHLISAFDQNYTHDRLGYRRERIFLFKCPYPSSVPIHSLGPDEAAFISINECKNFDIRHPWIKTLVQTESYKPFTGK